MTFARKVIEFNNNLEFKGTLAARHQDHESVS